MKNYPILLLHGANCRNDGKRHYYGRLPDILKEMGWECHLLYGDAWGTIESNCQKYQRQINRIMRQTRCEKVHLLAHSKGGLEARYLVSSMGMGGRVASVTTLSTPHHGSRTAAVWAARPKRLRLIGSLLEVFWRKRGDTAPDVTAVVQALTPEAMAIFNKKNPDVPEVHYRSFGAALGRSRLDLGMVFLSRCLTHWDGKTDGLVSPESAIWSENHCFIHDISHRDLVDNRRKDLNHGHDMKAFCEELSKWLEQVEKNK